MSLRTSPPTDRSGNGLLRARVGGFNLGSSTSSDASGTSLLEQDMDVFTSSAAQSRKRPPSADSPLIQSEEVRETIFFSFSRFLPLEFSRFLRLAFVLGPCQQIEESKVGISHRLKSFPAAWISFGARLSFLRSGIFRPSSPTIISRRSNHPIISFDTFEDPSKTNIPINFHGKRLQKFFFLFHFHHFAKFRFSDRGDFPM
jgi:hypothetical protein